MKESYREELASRSGLDPYAGDGDVAGVASVRGNAGQPLSSEIITSACRSCPVLEKARSSMPLFGEASANAAESKNLCMRRHPKRENVYGRSFRHASPAPFDYAPFDKLPSTSSGSFDRIYDRTSEKVAGSGEYPAANKEFPIAKFKDNDNGERRGDQLSVSQFSVISNGGYGGYGVPTVSG